MRTLFKIIILMLITSFQIQAQKETLYSNSYQIDANTTALLEFKGSSVEIYKSLDDKFHIEYTIEFVNYPNRKKKAAIESVKIESDLSNNQITVADKSKFSMYRFYQFETISNILYLRNKSTDTSYSPKSEDAFRNVIIEAQKPVPFYIRYIQNSNQYSEDEKKKSIEKYNNRKKRRKVIKTVKIKVPNNLSLTINAKASTIRIQDNLENQISLRVDGGKVYTQNLSNSNNIIKMKDAPLIANSINGGKLILDNSKRTLIGELKDVKLNSEFSLIEIGQIKNNVEITDFTSKYLIHNFSNNFKELIMNTEYSEMNFFIQEGIKSSFTTKGSATKHYVENKLFDYKNHKSYNKVKGDIMLDVFINTSSEGSIDNKISITTHNGIIRISKDIIKH